MCELDILPLIVSEKIWAYNYTTHHMVNINSRVSGSRIIKLAYAPNYITYKTMTVFCIAHSIQCLYIVNYWFANKLTEPIYSSSIQRKQT